MYFKNIQNILTIRFLKYEFNNTLLGGVTLSNVTPSNNLLWNSYFENPTVELYVINKHANFMSIGYYLSFDP